MNFGEKMTWLPENGTSGGLHSRKWLINEIECILDNLSISSQYNSRIIECPCTQTPSTCLKEFVETQALILPRHEFLEYMSDIYKEIKILIEKYFISK